MWRSLYSWLNRLLVNQCFNCGVGLHCPLVGKAHGQKSLLAKLLCDYETRIGGRGDPYRSCPAATKCDSSPVPLSPCEGKSAGISLREASSVEISFRECRSAGKSFREGGSVGIAFAEARETTFRQNCPRQTTLQQIPPSPNEIPTGPPSLMAIGACPFWPSPFRGPSESRVHTGFWTAGRKTVFRTPRSLRKRPSGLKSGARFPVRAVRHPPFPQVGGPSARPRKFSSRKNQTRRRFSK